MEILCWSITDKVSHVVFYKNKRMVPIKKTKPKKKKKKDILY